MEIPVAVAVAQSTPVSGSLLQSPNDILQDRIMNHRKLIAKKVEEVSDFLTHLSDMDFILPLFL